MIVLRKKARLRGLSKIYPPVRAGGKDQAAAFPFTLTPLAAFETV